MSEKPEVGRYTLVPKVGDGGRVRRYSLARIGVARRSALGEDRHERLERVAGFSPDGAGPLPAPDRDPGPAAP